MTDICDECGGPIVSVDYDQNGRELFACDICGKWQEFDKTDVWKSNAGHPGTPYAVWSAQLRDAADIVERLLAALEAIEAMFDGTPGFDRNKYIEAMKLASEAIASVKHQEI